MSADNLFLKFYFFRTSGRFSHIFNYNFGISFFFFENFENLEFSKFKINNHQFINATALRAPPAVPSLAVHRRLQVARGWKIDRSSKSEHCNAPRKCGSCKLRWMMSTDGLKPSVSWKWNWERCAHSVFMKLGTWRCLANIVVQHNRIS